MEKKNKKSVEQKASRQAGTFQKMEAISPTLAKGALGSLVMLHRAWLLREVPWSTSEALAKPWCSQVSQLPAQHTLPLPARLPICRGASP